MVTRVRVSDYHVGHGDLLRIGIILAILFVADCLTIYPAKFRLEKLDHKIREHQIRVSGWNIVENIVVFPVKSQNVEKIIRTPLALYKEIY